ncbi:MAG: hypothetical protein JO103_07165 [Candidatus Eremiobacteraeota bacterium]|nr:hypothetical protein [Candidatus Eremiobacteraeota bacterium]
MNTTLPRRRVGVRVKPWANGLELLLAGLMAMAVVDCMLIVWLVVRGFGD